MIELRGKLFYVWIDIYMYACVCACSNARVFMCVCGCSCVGGWVGVEVRGNIDMNSSMNIPFIHMYKHWRHCFTLIVP